MLEANRFWFYSLVFSIFGGWVELRSGGGGKKEAGKKAVRVGEKVNGGASPIVKGVNRKGEETRGDRAAAAAAEKHRTRRRLVADCFDLLIPGHVTGWISTGPSVVGCASVISTLLSSKDIWDRLEVER